MVVHEPKTDTYFIKKLAKENDFHFESTSKTPRVFKKLATVISCPE